MNEHLTDGTVVIVFRPNSPLGTIYRRHQIALTGDSQHPCIAIQARNLRTELPGFLLCDPVYTDGASQQHLKNPSIHLALSEILLISHAPAPDLRQIGFLPTG